MTLMGTIHLNKRLRQHPIWQRPDYGWAWVDLLLLANDAPRTALVNGERVEVLRGQLVWSLRTLEKEWGKSGEWISHLLDFCKDHEMIRVDSNRRRTIITILNYAAYNPTVTVTEPGTEPETETVTNTGTEPEQKGEVGIGNRKEEVRSAPRLFDLALALRLFATEDSGYTPDQVREQWLYYDAMRDPRSGDWQKPRGDTGAMTRITDPRSELARALQRFACTEKKTGGGNGVSDSVSAIQTEKELRSLEQDIEQDRQTNQPRDPKKIARVRELRATLAKLKS